MQATAHGNARTRLALYALTALFLVAPGYSHAAVSVSAHQILPPDQQTCPVVGATDITPFVYDGALHSFDITVSDPSYVAIGAQVGDMAVGFNLITRWFDQNGGVRLHVDVPTTVLTADTPVAITLVSAHPGSRSITCVVTVTTVIPATTSNGHAGTGSSGSSSGPASAPGTSGGTTSHAQRPSYPWGHITYTTAKPAPQPTKPAATTTHIAPLVTATHSLGDACLKAGGPAKLWGILLVLYAVFVWIISIMRGKDIESSDWNVGLVVAGFLGLLFFWYVSAACRPRGCPR